MSDTLPIVYIARHVETAWSLTGQHTGRTDLPLVEHGEAVAGSPGNRLKGWAFTSVFVSPCGGLAARLASLAMSNQQ